MIIIALLILQAKSYHRCKHPCCICAQCSPKQVAVNITIFEHSRFVSFGWFLTQWTEYANRIRFSPPFKTTWKRKIWPKHISRTSENMDDRHFSSFHTRVESSFRMLDFPLRPWRFHMLEFLHESSNHSFCVTWSICRHHILTDEWKGRIKFKILRTLDS